MEDFIRKNREILRKIFQKRIAEIKDNVFTMPKGEMRDLAILFVKEYEDYWLNNVLKEPELPKESVSFV